MTFSEKLVRLRKLKGITQDEFASAVGVSRQAVYKWESGQSYPEVPKLLEMKLIFGISIDDLLDESYEVILPEKKKRKRAPRNQTAPTEQVVKTPVEPTPEPVAVAAPTAEAEPTPVNEQELPKEEVKTQMSDTESDSLKKLYYDGLQKKEDETKQPEKKKGFFKRLFGR